MRADRYCEHHIYGRLLFSDPPMPCIYPAWHPATLSIPVSCVGRRDCLRQTWGHTCRWCMWRAALCVLFVTWVGSAFLKQFELFPLFSLYKSIHFHLYIHTLHLTYPDIPIFLLIYLSFPFFLYVYPHTPPFSSWCILTLYYYHN